MIYLRPMLGFFKIQRAFYLLFHITLFALFFASCKNDLEEVNKITTRPTGPVETGTNIEFLYSDSAKIKTKVNAPYVSRYLTPKPLRILPKGVHVQFYDDSMHVTSSLTAKFAMQKEDERLMEARNDVVVVNAKGERLNTEKLVWDEKMRKIYSDQFVKITTADEIIIGNGFESNEDFTRYKIFDIKGTFAIDKEKTN